MANRYGTISSVVALAMGGLNMCRKIAHTCEMFGVRTAWHGPNNVDPVGHCYNVHLDLASPNFGIQEETFFSEQAREVFPGCPEIRGGYMFANDKPGFAARPGILVPGRGTPAPTEIRFPAPFFTRAGEISPRGIRS